MLSEAPMSGSGVEHHFQCEAAESSRWAWFSFESGPTKWCGAFRAGSHVETDKAVVVDDHAIILAGGVCYCVDLERHQIRFTLRSSSYSDLIAIPDTSNAALADFDAVTVIDFDGVKWTSPRIAWDGVRFTSATRSAIFGVAETGHGAFDERVFQIDLLRQNVTGGHVEDFRS
jgi:hypothetical protein